MEDVFSFIDVNRERFVQELMPLVGQPSISAIG